MQSIHVVRGDILAWAGRYRGPKFHAMLADPPYEMGFFGAEWDSSGVAFLKDTWAALMPHMLPGAMGMAYASGRGWHRLACAIEDAGNRIYHSLFAWVHIDNMPKCSRLDVAMDNMAGYGRRPSDIWDEGYEGPDPSVPVSELAKAWFEYRYGDQAVRSVVEPLVVFQNPLDDAPIPTAALHGTGAFNIGAVRLPTDDDISVNTARGTTDGGYGFWNESRPAVRHTKLEPVTVRGRARMTDEWKAGRWPTNLVLQHLPECVPVDVTVLGEGEYATPVEVWQCPPHCPVRLVEDQGGGYTRPVLWGDGADPRGFSRNFYNASWAYEVAEALAAAPPAKYMPKAQPAERGQLYPQLYWKVVARGRFEEVSYEEYLALVAEEDRIEEATGRRPCLAEVGNVHLTVKPVAMNEWLAQLLLPPKRYAPRRILVPFAGTLSEALGALEAGWDHVTAVELEPVNTKIGAHRIGYYRRQPKQLAMFDALSRPAAHDASGRSWEVTFEDIE